MDYRTIGLAALVIISILTTAKEPDVMKEVRRLYELLRKDPDFIKTYPELQREVIITGMLRKGQVGYNINKGYEIYICLDGADVNQVMHVLLHELAHVTVSEFQHSGGFWENLHKIKSIAARMGIYTGISRTSYCGHYISD
jgi:hypothetical protein